MIVGVDFDNTIVCYDQLIYSEALKRGLVSSDVAATKQAIRDHLRNAGKEDDWTELQGYIYGAGISGAIPFPGAMEFFRRCQETGVKTCIISHKTKYPYAGEKYDLHLAASQWLTDNGFLNHQSTGLSEVDVAFAPTKLEKLRMIGELNCSIFIDDLPEFLAEPSFPSDVKKILFDPNDAFADQPTSTITVERVTSFQDLLLLLPLALMKK